MMKIKSKQKLRIIRHFPTSETSSGSHNMIVNCTYGKLDETVDYWTACAVEEAVQTIASGRFQYKGISATFLGISLQVNLID